MTLTACPACDALQHLPSLDAGARARCVRCGETLAIEPGEGWLGRALALAAAAAIVLAIGNATPLMELSALGRHSSTTVLGGAYALWQHGYEGTAALVVFACVLAPAAYLSLLLAVLWLPRGGAVLMRHAGFMLSWSMPEVMLLGILVALIKIAALARVIPGVGLYAMGLLVILLAALRLTFDPRQVWRRVEWQR
jgi:paraquat-inducible protein A